MIRTTAQRAFKGRSIAYVSRVLGASHAASSSQHRHGYHHQSKSSYSYRNTVAGALLGAAGAATIYLWQDEESSALCKADQWVYKPKTARSAAPATKSQSESTPNAASTASAQATDDSLSAGDVETGSLPSHVPYLIIGAGTAAMAAYRAIRTREPLAKVLLIGEEEYKPYMRPPLSKDMWFTEDRQLVDNLRFKTWSGKDRSLFYEHDSYYCQPQELSSSEKGGVAVAVGKKVLSLDPMKHLVVLDSGEEMTYDRCLLATGGKPRLLPTLEQAGQEVLDKCTLFRGINGFRRLEAATDSARSVLVIGGGFLGSELACALGKKSEKNGMKVIQAFPETGNMARVLPSYLSDWTTDRVRQEGVQVLTDVSVEAARLSDDKSQVELLLSDKSEVAVDHVVVAVGLEPNTDLSVSAGLEVDPTRGGFLVDAELRAATDLWVAGDAASFYDVKLGRRRVEHHDHAVVSGRLAGENMAGAGKRFTHQSMFWSDLGPAVGYEAIGLVDSSLPTVAVFAKASQDDTPLGAEQQTGESIRSEAATQQTNSSVSPSGSDSDLQKGVIFYLQNKRIVGVLCWNVFNKIGIARKVIKDGAEHEDLTEVAKLFDLHPSAITADASS